MNNGQQEETIRSTDHERQTEHSTERRIIDGRGRGGGGGGGRPTTFANGTTFDVSGGDNIPHDTIADNTQQNTGFKSIPGISAGVERIPRRNSNVISAAVQPRITSYTNSQNMAEQSETYTETRPLRILRHLQRSSGYYLSDVVDCGTDAGANEFSTRIQQYTDIYKRGLLLISRENTTVHIVHDCAFSTGTCRCAFFQKTEIMSGFRRRYRARRTRPYCNKIQLPDIENILHYFNKEPRNTCYLKVGGQLERIPPRNQTVAQQGPCIDENVAGKNSEDSQEDSVPLFGEEYANNELTGPYRKGREASTLKQRGKVGGKQVFRMEKMMDIFKKYPMSPIEGITKHRVWLTHPDLRFLSLQDKEVKGALFNWTNQLLGWSCHDFNDLYSAPDCTPIFGAGYSPINDYYYTPDESVNILDELLHYQYNNDDEQCMIFMTDLYNVLERKLPKLNTILIHSPPSSGKNYFFDCIKDFYINCGNLGNANKYNNFPFQDAESRRIILWNEPNYSPEFLEPIKKLFGGDSTCVNVKYMADMPVYRTPVIVLTNHNLSCMTQPAFLDRIVIHRWQSAPYLVTYGKKPHPLATYALYRKYGLCE